LEKCRIVYFVTDVSIQKLVHHINT